MSKLIFNANDFNLKSKIDRLYKIRKQQRELQSEILELKEFIVNRFDFIDDCDYDVMISTVKGRVNYKKLAEYYLNIDNINLDYFRFTDVLHLKIKEFNDNYEDFDNE